MSGQPCRYSTDQASYRAEYMKNLQERIDLDDMVLQAVKGYVSNGTLPAISQMTDTRTTAEKLLDIQKLKQEMIKDLAPIMDPQAADRIIQGLIQSPLNSDNRLVIFFSQRAPEIVSHLQKIYKYGVKGDVNDITTFVEFLNNMYLEKNKATASVKSFIDRSGTSGQSATTRDDLLNLSITYSNFTADLLRKLRPTGAEGVMIKDIGRRLDMLIQYLPTDLQIARLYELIRNPAIEGIKGPRPDSFLFMGPIDNLVDFINKSLPNKNIFYQLVQDFQNLVRPINKSYEESYAEEEGILTKKQYAETEVRRTKKIERSTMDLLTRLSSILPTEEVMKSVFTPEILEFLRTEVDIHPPKFSTMNEGVYAQQPYVFGSTSPADRGMYEAHEEDDEEVGRASFVKPAKGNDVNFTLSPGQTLGERATGYKGVSDKELVKILEKFNEEEAAVNSSSQSRNAVGRIMEEMQRRKTLPEEDPLKNIFKTIQGIIITDVSRDRYKTKVNGANLSDSDRRDIIEKKEADMETLIFSLQEQIENLDTPTLANWDEAKTKNPIAGQIERINELVGEYGDARMKGFGFKKKRLGRPRGSGFRQNIESHIDTHKGIQPDFRFSKFGKYLIRNDHLMDNTVSIRTGKGLNITGLPSTKTNSKVITIIRKIIGGALPTFEEMNKLTEEEKRYLHDISKKANILEKLNIPTPSKDKEEKDFNEFEILRGEIMAGNDNKDLVRKFKGYLLKFSKTGQLPKQQVNDILQDMLDLNL